MPFLSDIMKYYSNLDSFVSVEGEKCSEFIQKITEVFKENKESYNLMDMINRINFEMAQDGYFLIN